MKDTVKLYQAEQEILKKYREADPESVLGKRNYTYQQILQHIGIDIDFGFLPQGYLNLYPQDFIVEELSLDGSMVTIEPEDSALMPPPSAAEKTLYADLVKVGLSTLEAGQEIASALGLPPTSVSFAGIKDKVAITSQRISVRGAAWEKLKDLKVPGIFLKNFSWGKGIAEKGKLLGNQFTILVRTPSTLGAGWLDQALNRVRDGFYNFYYLQRFGSPRLLSHKNGKLILQQDYRGAIKTFLTDTGVQDMPLITDLRQQALAEFGHWEKVDEIFSRLPYTFRLEQEIVGYLKNKPADFLGALKNAILDQTTLWIYAYASYLFNLELSRLIKAGEKIPASLPLLLNPKYKTIKSYTDKLQADGVSNIEPALIQVFGRLPLEEKNVCQTVMPVKIIRTKIIEKGVIICFQLPAATYATTFLTHLFALYRGLPKPEWLNQQKYDSKEILGTGSVKKVEAILGEYIFTHAESE